MKPNFALLRGLSITLLVAASQFASPAHADRGRDQRDAQANYSSERIERGAYQERQPVRGAQQYAADNQSQYQQPQYQQPQQQGSQAAQPKGRRYLPDAAPSDGERNNNYAGRNPQYSREDEVRAERDRQTERRALLRRQINEARDLYAPVRKQ